MARHQSKLHKRYGTHPVMTLAIPLIVNIPIFVIFSLTIRHAIEMPGSAMAAESFGWLKALGEPDLWLPAIGGGLGMLTAQIGENRRKATASAVDNGAEHKMEKVGDGKGVRDSRSPVSTAPRSSPSPQPTRLPRRSISTSIARSFTMTSISCTSNASRPPKASSRDDLLRRRKFPKQPSLTTADLAPTKPTSLWSPDRVNRGITRCMRFMSLGLVCIGPLFPSVSSVCRRGPKVLLTWRCMVAGSRVILGHVDVFHPVSEHVVHVLDSTPKTTGGHQSSTDRDMNKTFGICNRMLSMLNLVLHSGTMCDDLLPWLVLRSLRSLVVPHLFRLFLVLSPFHQPIDHIQDSPLIKDMATRLKLIG